MSALTTLPRSETTAPASPLVSIIVPGSRDVEFWLAAERELTEGS